MMDKTLITFITCIVKEVFAFFNNNWNQLEY